MVLLLSFVYWTIGALIAIPMKIMSDPLSLKRGRFTKWVVHNPVSDMISGMLRQG